MLFCRVGDSRLGLRGFKGFLGSLVSGGQGF